MLAAVAAMLAPPALAAAKPRVLLVGTYHGIRGRYRTIAQALAHARPYDWILVGPGDYKSSRFTAPAGHPEFPAADLITVPNLTIRGMNRNTVIIDGTKSGPACSDAPSDQNFGPTTAASPHTPIGTNGLEVWKAHNVAIENLTSCNFLGGNNGETGNEVWWNGGDGSGTIGGWGYYGAYLNGTSTWYDQGNPSTSAEYGIFSSNWDGGTWYQDYASNMQDSGFYIGACQQQCNQTVNRVWSEYSALGYSGSNSGGNLVIENSQFDNNEDGFDTNSQNGDNPPPQIGLCPNNGISRITGTHSCWVFIHNFVHDNNNPNVPAAGFAGYGPVGTGMSLSGGRFDTVMDNTFTNNGAWGIIFVPFPDSGPPCTGGVTNFPGISCLFDEYGDALLNNRFINDGFFGNPTNGPFDQVNVESGEATDCYAGNTVPGGALSPDAASLQKNYPVCNGQDVPANFNVPFFDQVACDSGVGILAGLSAPCVGGGYPRLTGVTDGLHPLPPARELPTMPHVCRGVPANPWCPGAARHHARPGRHHRRARRGVRA